MTENTMMNTQQQTTPTPEEIGGAGRMFSQKEVNDIVAARLARERERLADSDEYRAKYESVLAELYDLKAANLHRTKADAYRALLKKANISEKRIDTVIKASTAAIDALELDENGAAVGADKLVESIKEEWADFVVYTTTQGAQISRPPWSPYYSGGEDRVADAFKPKI